MPTCALHQFFILIAAWLLDALIGDPEKLPHPVRADRRIYRLDGESCAAVV